MTKISDRTASTLRDIPVFDAAEVEARLAGANLKAILAAAFAGLANGEAVQPPQTLALLPRDAGDFILYSAALSIPPLFGVKVSPYLTHLARAGEVPVTAYSILFSSENGRPLLNFSRRSTTGTMVPRRLITPLMKAGAFGTLVTVS